MWHFDAYAPLLNDLQTRAICSSLSARIGCSSWCWCSEIGLAGCSWFLMNLVFATKNAAINAYSWKSSHCCCCHSWCFSWERTCLGSVHSSYWQFDCFAGDGHLEFPLPQDHDWLLSTRDHLLHCFWCLSPVRWRSLSYCSDFREVGPSTASFFASRCTSSDVQFDAEFSHCCTRIWPELLQPHLTAMTASGFWERHWCSVSGWRDD